MHWFKGLGTGRLEREQEGYYIKNGSKVLEEFLALCDGNCRIPIRYFAATEIERATKHLQVEIDLWGSYVVTGSLDNHLVLVRYFTYFRGEYSKSKEISRDIAITAQMSHLKNVLKLIGCCLDLKHPVMVYEYIEPITLDKLLFSNIYGQSLSWETRLRIATQIASAVVFLHTEFKTPIIQRNLKPSNVMIDNNTGVAKLFDFSFSISLPPGELQVEDTLYGIIGYLDPEYGKSRIITQKTDVFSFGVVLFELLAGRTVLNIFEEFHSFEFNIKECNVMDIVDPAILEKHGIGIQQQLEAYFDLVKKCTSPQEEDRPYMIDDAAKELRRIHKFFRALSPNSLHASY